MKEWMKEWDIQGSLWAKDAQRRKEERFSAKETWTASAWIVIMMMMMFIKWRGEKPREETRRRQREEQIATWRTWQAAAWTWSPSSPIRTSFSCFSCGSRISLLASVFFLLDPWDMLSFSSDDHENRLLILLLTSKRRWNFLLHISHNSWRCRDTTNSHPHRWSTIKHMQREEKRKKEDARRAPVREAETARGFKPTISWTGCKKWETRRMMSGYLWRCRTQGPAHRKEKRGKAERKRTLTQIEADRKRAGGAKRNERKEETRRRSIERESE